MTATTLPASWVNGVAVPPSGVAISPRDRGVTLGDGVFETMRVESGQIFRRQLHLLRLQRALSALHFPAIPELDSWLTTATMALGGGNGTVRLTVTRGIGTGGWSPSSAVQPAPTVILTAGPLPQFPDTIYEHGLTVRLASDRRNEHARTTGLKTTTYVDSVVALMEAQRAGADDALFLDTAGHCSEGTTSNLFICRGGDLITPPLTCGVLPGITRHTIMEIAPDLGLAVVERAIDLDEALGADEAFLTSSLRGVAPVARLEDTPIGSGRPGALTTRLRAAYTALVARECGG